MTELKDRDAHRRAHVKRNGTKVLLALQMFDRFVERRVRGRQWLSEVQVGLLNGDIRCQTFFVDHRVGRREIEQMREQQAAAIGKANETLTSSAAERALANERCALVASQCCREQL